MQDIESLYHLIVKLRRSNAVHIKSGIHLRDLTDEQMLKQFSSELIELTIAIISTGVRYELADCLVVLLHIAIREGFTVNQIVEAAHEKVDMRFKIKDR